MGVESNASLHTGETSHAQQAPPIEKGRLSAATGRLNRVASAVFSHSSIRHPSPTVSVSRSSLGAASTAAPAPPETQLRKTAHAHIESRQLQTDGTIRQPSPSLDRASGPLSKQQSTATRGLEAASAANAFTFRIENGKITFLHEQANFATLSQAQWQQLLQAATKCATACNSREDLALLGQFLSLAAKASGTHVLDFVRTLEQQKGNFPKEYNQQLNNLLQMAHKYIALATKDTPVHSLNTGTKARADSSQKSATKMDITALRKQAAIRYTPEARKDVALLSSSLEAVHFPVTFNPDGSISKTNASTPEAFQAAFSGNLTATTVISFLKNVEITLQSDKPNFELIQMIFQAMLEHAPMAAIALQSLIAKRLESESAEKKLFEGLLQASEIMLQEHFKKRLETCLTETFSAKTLDETAMSLKGLLDPKSLLGGDLSGTRAPFTVEDCLAALADPATRARSVPDENRCAALAKDTHVYDVHQRLWNEAKTGQPQYARDAIELQIASLAFTHSEAKSAATVIKAKAIHHLNTQNFANPDAIAALQRSTTMLLIQLKAIEELAPEKLTPILDALNQQQIQSTDVVDTTCARAINTFNSLATALGKDAGTAFTAAITGSVWDPETISLRQAQQQDVPDTINPLMAARKKEELALLVQDGKITASSFAAFAAARKEFLKSHDPSWNFKEYDAVVAIVQNQFFVDGGQTSCTIDATTRSGLLALNQLVELLTIAGRVNTQPLSSTQKQMINKALSPDLWTRNGMEKQAINSPRMKDALSKPANERVETLAALLGERLEGGVDARKEQQAQTELQWSEPLPETQAMREARIAQEKQTAVQTSQEALLRSHDYKITQAFVEKLLASSLDSLEPAQKTNAEMLYTILTHYVAQRLANTEIDAKNPEGRALIYQLTTMLGALNWSATLPSEAIEGLMEDFTRVLPNVDEMKLEIFSDQLSKIASQQMRLPPSIDSARATSLLHQRPLTMNPLAHQIALQSGS